MEKFNFNALGVQQLLAALYALNDEELNAEAAALQNDFTGWCMQHFYLNTNQLSYLMGMDAAMQRQLADRGSYFLTQRWPVNLLQATPSPLWKGDEDSAKIFDLEEKKTSTYSPNTGYQSSNVLNIQITYPAS